MQTTGSQDPQDPASCSLPSAQKERKVEERNVDSAVEKGSKRKAELQDAQRAKESAIAPFVRDLSRQIKAAKKFKACKVIRKLNEAKEKNGNVNLQTTRLRCCKSISTGDLTRHVLLKEFNLPVPRKIAAAWPKPEKASPSPSPTTSTSNTAEDQRVKDELVAQILQSTTVRKAKARFAKLSQAALKDLKIHRKRQRDERRTIVCGVQQCTAKFATKEALQTHRRRRHADVDLDPDQFGDRIEEDPLKKLGEIRQASKKRKKNRMGQRARRREAIKKQIAEHQAAIQRGEKPPVYKRIEIPGRTRPKEARGEDGNGHVDVSVAEEAAPEKLHPSWQAKKKEKDAAHTEFKGSRIVFD